MSNLVFKDTNEYKLATWEWVNPATLRWHNGTWNGPVSKNDKRIRSVDTGKTEKVKVGEDITTGEPVYEEQPIIEEQEFYPFEEALKYGNVPEFDQAAWDAEQAELQEQEQIQKFRAARQQQVGTLTVQISNGTNFHADEAAQRRMLSAILAAEYRGLSDSDTLPSGWSTADVPTGVMDTSVTLRDLKEAHALSIEAMGQVWSVK